MRPRIARHADTAISRTEIDSAVCRKQEGHAVQWSGFLVEAREETVDEGSFAPLA
jgi:hypothetical protein